MDVGKPVNLLYFLLSYPVRWLLVVRGIIFNTASIAILITVDLYLANKILVSSGGNGQDSLLIQALNGLVWVKFVVKGLCVQWFNAVIM